MAENEIFSNQSDNLCRQAQEVLRESEERHRTILQTAMDGFWMADIQGRIMEVNETYCRMSGYSAQELLAMHIPDLEAAETADDTAAHIQKIMAQGEDRFESLHRRKDGSIFNVEISVQYRQFEGGRFAVFLRDITERTRAEEALQKIRDELEQRVLERTSDLLSANESLRQEMETRRRAEKELLRHQALLSSIIESTSEAIFAKDAAGRYHSINEAGARMLGYCATDVIGRTDMELLPAETAREFRITDENVISSGQAYVREETGVISGKTCIFLAHKTPWRDHSGKIIGVIGVSNDITERKRAEELLFNSKASLTMILDGISDPITLLDAQYRVKRMNLAARDYYGLTSYLEAAGKLCFEVRGKLRPCDGCERPFSELDGFSGSYERKGAMDPDKIEQVVVDVVNNESGAPEAYIVRIYDITQAKMMERKILQSEKLASLGLLISGIAHEINNPNTFVSFNIPILREYLQALTQIVDTHAGNHPDLELCGMPYPEFCTDIFKLVDNMEHGSSRINATVSSLKEFSRTREHVKKRLIALNDVIEKALAICGAELRKRVKSFKVTIPDDLPALYTDPEAVEQVLINLLINAVHALDKEDSWIKVSVIPGFRHGQLEHCIIEVADNGSGMDEKIRNKIFDPFFTTKTAMLGTGLGLYVCQNLIEKLGGKIELDSEPGVGSIFRVILHDMSQIHGGKSCS